MRPRLLIPLVLTLLQTYQLFADIGHGTSITVWCRTTGVVQYNKQVPIYLHKLAKPEEAFPNKTGPNGAGADWGNATKYTGEDGRENCNGKKYSYVKVEGVGTNWSTIFVDYFGDEVTFTHATNHAFWNWYYGDDYEQPSKCDYTQNCHGFAFGVGDNPDNAIAIADLNAGKGTPPKQPCWHIPDETHNSTVQSVTAIHSIKISWHKCGRHQRISKSEEQYAESGTYSQTHTCGKAALNLWEVHDKPREPDLSSTKDRPKLYLRRRES